MDYGDEYLYVRIESHASSPNWKRISRGVVFFPETADIPDGSTVNSASLFIYIDNAYDGFGGLKLQVVAATPGTEHALTTDDFDQFGTTVLGEILLADIVAAAYNEITLTTSCINKTGTTILGLRLDKDVSNNSTHYSDESAQVAISTADHANPARRPFLTTSY